MIAIPMRVSVNKVSIPVGVSASGVNLAVGIGATYVAANKEYYKGSYVFTPSDEMQTVPTADKVLSENIVINPVPSNYGRITYNGAVITVY